MGRLYDENGNEVGYIYDGDENNPLIEGILFFVIFVLPFLAWIYTIKEIFSGDTPAAHRVIYIVCLTSVIVTMLICGRIISKRKNHTFLRTGIQLIACGTIITGIIISLLSMKEPGMTLFTSFRIALMLSVAPAVVTTCIIDWKDVKEVIKSKGEAIKSIVSFRWLR